MHYKQWILSAIFTLKVHPMIYAHGFVVFCFLTVAAIHVYSEVNGCIPNLVILIIIIIVSWCLLGSLTSGFLWIRWRGKHSQHSQRMRNPQFHVSGKRLMPSPRAWMRNTGNTLLTTTADHLHNKIWRTFGSHDCAYLTRYVIGEPLYLWWKQIMHK